MLDSLGGDNTNIKDLNIEEPAKRVEPSPLDQILSSLTEEEWKGIVGSVSPSDTEAILVLKILSPKRMEEKVNTPGFNIPRHFSQVLKYKEQEVWSVFAENTAYLKLAFPDKISELGVDNQTWGNMLVNLAANPGGVVERTLRMTYYMYLISPSKAKDLELAENENLFKSTAQFTRKNVGSRWWFAVYKTLFPEKYREIALTKDELKQDYNLMENWRKSERWSRFLAAAANLRILEADEVKVTEQGMEIIDKAPEVNLESTIPPIPETRKF
ncbi:MAG: hypothetical protein Q7R49_01700 [Candidatus Daviesbacteria bacterium]|nr:hypothetical protein [Candidatus Daviesbacteria bacterium]